MGNHTETLEVDFDRSVLSFDGVLEEFWRCHNPFAGKRGRQYMTAFFWRDAEQHLLVDQHVARLEAERGTPVTTTLLAFERFHLAEAYHQKYMLRRHAAFEAPLLEVYPKLADFVNSTAAARLNGYLAGYGSREAVAQDLPLLGLAEGARAKLLAAR